MTSEPSSSRSAELSVRTAARVPTGMKTGVRNVPRAVVTVPARAPPSVASTRRLSTWSVVGGDAGTAGNLPGAAVAPRRARRYRDGVELRFLYVGTTDTGRELTRWLAVPGARLRWRFQHFGADVAAIDTGA